MRTLTAQIAGRALTLAMTATIAGAVGAEACSAIVPDSLPSLFCQPDDETPSETCPSGQTCGVAGQCVPVPACASGDPCPGDASAEGAIDTLPDGADAALPDGSGDSLGDDSGDDGGGDALTCDPLQGGAVGCPCATKDQCGRNAPHCMPPLVDAGGNDAGGDALVGYCSHGCQTDDDCAPLSCSPVTRACAP
jgi:hypothetical protein